MSVKPGLMLATPPTAGRTRPELQPGETFVFHVVRTNGDAAGDVRTNLWAALVDLADFPGTELRECATAAMGAGAAANARVLRRTSRDDCFDAWLRALLLHDHGPAAVTAAAAVAGATLDGWRELLWDWQAYDALLSHRTALELDLLHEFPAAPDEYASFLSRALDGDTSVARRLEAAAFRRRELMAFRFARALSEDKGALAKFFAGRIGK